MSSGTPLLSKFERLEASFGFLRIGPNAPNPGTILERAMVVDKKGEPPVLGWRLSLGELGGPKLSFESASLNGVFQKARISAKMGRIAVPPVGLVT